jgi:hypothetical protein
VPARYKILLNAVNHGRKNQFSDLIHMNILEVSYTEMEKWKIVKIAARCSHICCLYVLVNTLSLLMSCIYIYIYIYGAPSKDRYLTSYIYIYGQDFLLGILPLEPCISLIYA